MQVSGVDMGNCMALQIYGGQFRAGQGSMVHRHGFTLVELLVVVAIIAVLAAVLFPVFSRVRQKSHEVACVSNLKQLLAASAMYAQDYDRTLVPARAGTAPGTLGYSWCVLLQPYLKSEQILFCPLEREGQVAARTTDLPHSYGINFSLTFNAGGFSSAPYTYRIAALDDVSSLIMFFDLKPGLEAMGSSYATDRLRRVDGRHFGRANFGFLDGHAKSMTAEETAEPKNLWLP